MFQNNSQFTCSIWYITSNNKQIIFARYALVIINWFPIEIFKSSNLSSSKKKKKWSPTNYSTPLLYTSYVSAVIYVYSFSDYIPLRFLNIIPFKALEFTGRFFFCFRLFFFDMDNSSFFAKQKKRQ